MGPLQPLWRRGRTSQQPALPSIHDPDRVFLSQFDIKQAELLNGTYAKKLNLVLRSGARFFSVPYTRQDGFGEGADGPRAKQRAALYPYYTNFPFLRLNGLTRRAASSAISLAVCIGPVTRRSGACHVRAGGTAGAAGIASNAFINDEFPARTMKFIRNPPHTFGSGYLQQLAVEMSLELNAQREVVQQLARAIPGERAVDIAQVQGN